MHCQWEGYCTRVENPGGLQWHLIAQKACLGGRYRHKKEKYTNPAILSPQPPKLWSLHFQWK